MSICRSRQGAAVGVAALVVASVLVPISTARACSTVGLQPQQVNPALAATDTVAPVLTAQTKVELYIFHSDQEGCGAHSSCDGLAMINLKVAVMDDQSTPERIGYRLNVVGGTVPPGVALPQFDILAPGDVIPIPWSPKESGDTFRFELSVAPIDEAGNVGEAQRVVVQSNDGGGCQAAGARIDASAVLIIVAGLLLLVARGRGRSLT